MPNHNLNFLLADCIRLTGHNGMILHLTGPEPSLTTFKYRTLKPVLPSLSSGMSPECCAALGSVQSTQRSWKEKQKLTAQPKAHGSTTGSKYLCQESNVLLFSRWSKDVPELRLQTLLQKEHNVSSQGRAGQRAAAERDTCVLVTNTPVSLPNGVALENQI